jgi:hypothetical protein
LVGGRAIVAPSGSGTPNSKNIFSSPAGATEISFFAGLLLSFLAPGIIPDGSAPLLPPTAHTPSADTRDLITGIETKRNTPVVSLDTMSGGLHARSRL